MKVTFPELAKTSNDTFNFYILNAKSETENLRMCIWLVGVLTFFIPFSVYQSITEAPFYFDPLSWLLVIVFYKIGGFIYLFIEQKIIKKRLRKIIYLKY